MGFSKKAQADSGVESEGKKWVIAGISMRGALKPVNTKPRAREIGEEEDGNGESEEVSSRSTTPTAKEARIPEKLPCPPAPRKRRPSLRCHYNGGREFFSPPDLDTVFKCFVEKAN